MDKNKRKREAREEVVPGNERIFDYRIIKEKYHPKIDFGKIDPNYGKQLKPEGMLKCMDTQLAHVMIH